MVNSIPEINVSIREVTTTEDREKFWKELHLYHERDIFPEPRDNETQEELEYFLNDDEYRKAIDIANGRKEKKAYYHFLCADGEDVGFALSVIYDTEDNKCFVMEFCVFPEHRGKGLGTAFAQALKRWAKDEPRKAAYLELNIGFSERRKKFWEKQGFLPNGLDEWGNPLMILPPQEDCPIVVEKLRHEDLWQLYKLENGYLYEIGEEILTEEKTKVLAEAVKEGKINFFLAKRGFRAVGMCSVTTYFSTYNCGTVGSFEDFYVEPVFRKKGVGKKLSAEVKDWCQNNGVSSLTVICAPCDETMYEKLGFDVNLGVGKSMLTEGKGDV